MERSRRREIEALKFLHRNGFDQVPNPCWELSPTDGICLDYLDGRSPRQNTNTNRKILKMFMDLKDIYAKSQGFVDAVDACFSSRHILDQIESRIEKLSEGQRERLIVLYRRLEASAIIDFPRSSWTYSFSDVGAHNMIRKGKSYWFLDLEFFGRDSAVKMFADYILHPRNKISKRSLRELIDAANLEFGVSSSNLLSSIPFFAVKWATIVAKRQGTLNPNRRDHESSEKFLRYLHLGSLRNEREIHEFLLNEYRIVQ